MAKRKNKKSIKETNEQELFLFCYRNEVHFDQYNEYHYRLFFNGNILDVWPISKKFWNARMGRSRVYKTPEDLREFLFLL